MKDDYTVRYRVVGSGEGVDLVSITPHSVAVERLFYDGELLLGVYLEEDGLYDLKIKLIYEYDYLHSAIIGLERVV
jgi:hypothetical protein